MTLTTLKKLLTVEILAAAIILFVNLYLTITGQGGDMMLATVVTLTLGGGYVSLNHKISEENNK